eukprot:g289.t1
MHDRNKQVLVHFCGTFVLVVITASIMHALEYDTELKGAKEYSRVSNEVLQMMEAGNKTYELYCGGVVSASNCNPTSTSLASAKAYWDDHVSNKFSQTETTKVNGGSQIDVLNFVDSSGSKVCSTGKTKGCFTIIDPAIRTQILQVAGLESWDDAYGGGAAWITPANKEAHAGSINSASFDWAFPSAVFFAMTIVSTIGYGTFSASTDLGLVFTMIYAIFSISYFGYFLTITSDRILMFINWSAKKIYGHGYRIQPVAQLKVLVTVSFLYLFLLSLAGPILGGWSYGDSLYFAVITFTTVGLGDYAPSFDDEKDETYRAIGYFSYALGTLLGLALLSGVLGGITDVFQNVKVTVIGLGGKRRRRIANEVKARFEKKEKD